MSIEVFWILTLWLLGGALAGSWLEQHDPYAGAERWLAMAIWPMLAYGLLLERAFDLIDGRRT